MITKEKEITSYLQAINIANIEEDLFKLPVFEKCEKRDLVKKPKKEIIKTCCRACVANCGVLAHVENGKVVRLEGNPEDPMSKGNMCAKGLSGIQALYHPNRNKYPLKRVGERGGGKWKRVTWDLALEEVAEVLMDTKEKHGAESVFCTTGGGGNPEIWSIARFCNIFGTPNWFEPGCAQCYLPRVLAYTMMYGGVDPSIADSNALELYFPEDTPIECLVLWGTSPAYSCPSSGGNAVVELRAKGVKTISIDPRFTPDAAKADVWLPIRPGTDVALMFAWIKYILDNDLYDTEFVMRWSNLPYLVDVETKELLRASKSPDADTPDTFMIWDKKTNSAKALEYPWNEDLDPQLDGCFTIDGREYKTGFRTLMERVESYTIEKAAEICWLEPEKIEEAILMFAKNTPGGLALGVATDQNENSVQAAMAAATIDLLMANVERPGSLMQRFKTSGVLKMPNYPVPVANKMLPEGMLEKRLGANEHKGLHIWYAGHPGSVLDAILTEKPYKPRVWIDRSGNKLGVLAESSKWAEAIEKLDYIVHMFMYPTSFSAYADILLPAEEWLETNMVVETCNKLFARQQVTHLWDTIDETVFWSRLARKCADLGHEGCIQSFDAEFMGEDLAYWDTMEEFFDQITCEIDLTWKEFAEKAPFEYLPKDEWRDYYVYKQIDEKSGKPKGFETPSKKIELYLESMIELGRTGAPFTTVKLPPASKDYDPLPYYVEPAESPVRNDDVSKEYPLVMTGGRVPLYHHSTLRNVASVRELYPVPEIWVNPIAAKKYGIENEDWVWVESVRGKITAKALITKGINPGVVFMERFWNPETLNTDTHGWKEMNVNVLTKSSAPYNDVVGTHTLRGFQVKISKADGPPKGVWTKPEEYVSWLPAKVGPTKEG